MKPFWSISVLIFAVQWTWAHIGDEGVQIAGTNDKCAEFCSKTFRNQDTSTKSCQQGCRLFAVLQFVDKSSGKDGEPNATAISISCQKECSDAYKNPGLKGACVSGCQHQTPFTTGHLKIVMDESMPMSSIANKLMSDAFGKFDDIQNRMMAKFGEMSNWLKNDPFAKFEKGLQDNNGMNVFNRIDAQIRNMFTDLAKSSVVDTSSFPDRQTASKAAPVSSHEQVTVNPLFAYAKNIAQNRGHDASVQGSQIAKVKQSASPDDRSEPLLVIKIVHGNGLFDGDETRKMGPMMGNKIWSTFTQESLDEKPYEPLPPVLVDEKTYFGPAGTSVDSDDTWLACIARRTQNLPSLTRWFLCVALMLSILSMIYLCLAVMRAGQQRRRRLSLQYKMAKADTMYLMPPPNYEKMIPSPSYPFQDCEKQQESPPPAYDVAVGPRSAKSEDI